ncbi:hypothetical protein ACH5RR_007945 [Cinchona calisaya]|uniref:Late embryogenesis abundant protein LEA-2 subgroup domain-containing protein n=1 Tax=Cinchona calisaya TaxID=153742 RepID=A0ABD3ABT8_9GENT
MADRVHPSAAAASKPAAVKGGANPTFPPTKSQLYNTTRPLYRPQPPLKRRRRHSRSCFCSCCLWTTLFIIIILLLVAIAGTVFWVLYRPHRPNFTVSSVYLARFNLTSTGVTSNFNLTLMARNPNKKIKFIYDPIDVSVLSNGIDIGDGTFPGFEHGTKNNTSLKTVISSSSSSQSLDSTDISTLRADLKNDQNSLPLKIQLNTKVKVKVGGFKTKKIGIRVNCDGIKVGVPTGKTPTSATTSNVRCKVDLRIKIWKWTF